MGQDETRYDVFVSHSTADLEPAKFVCNELTNRGVSPFLAATAISPAEIWLYELVKQISASGAFLICCGPSGFTRYQQTEFNQAFRQRRTIIPVILPGGSLGQDPLSLLLGDYQVTDLSAGLDSPGSFDRLATAIRRASPVPAGRGQRTLAPPPPEPDPELHPYRGLFPFREKDAPYFFGRAGLTDRLEETVTEECITSLVGLSGSGKTSVLQAGLFPRLRARADGWEVISVRPGRHPVYALSNALVALLEPGLPDGVIKEHAETRAQSIIEGREPLVQMIGEVVAKCGEVGKNHVVLVIDPWEELYTLAEEAAKKERDVFVSGVFAETCSPESPLAILLACRTDFFNERVLHYKQLANRLHKRVIHILPMGPEQFLEAVERPLEQEEEKFSLEEGLSQRLLNDMAEEPGQLSLLEFALAELWKRRDHERKLLSIAAYEELGGLQRALNQRADEVVAPLDPQLARRLFLRLVDVQDDAPDTRRWAHIREFDSTTRSAIQRLEEQGLLVYGRDAKTGELTVELAHESLLRNWPRLQAWLKGDRSFRLWQERLEIELRAWTQGDRKRKYLLRGVLLKESDHWRSERSGDLSEEETEYIGKSVQAGRWRHTLWRIQVGLLLVIVTSGLIFLPLSWQQRKKEKSQGMAAEALQSKSRGLDIAMLLSLEAYQISDTVEARSSLLTLLEGSPRLKAFLMGDKQDVFSAVFDPAGRRAASGGGGKIYRWEVGDRVKRLREIELENATPITSLAFSRDGEILYVSKAKEPRIPPLFLAGRAAAIFRGTDRGARNPEPDDQPAA